jgi:hypothetical protein
MVSANENRDIIKSEVQFFLSCLDQVESTGPLAAARAVFKANYDENSIINVCHWSVQDGEYNAF